MGTQAISLAAGQYLAGNKAIAMTPEFTAAYAELMAEARHR